MNRLAELAERALARGELSREDGLWLATRADFGDLLLWANRVRERFFGNVVHLCAIINARSGACPEDCKFCAQSARHCTGVEVYPLVSAEKMLAAAGEAARFGADCFGIVTSGESIRRDPREFEAVCAAAKAINERGAVCASLSVGALRPEDIAALKAVRVRRIHHNLETSARFFPHVCTTHSQADRVETVRNIKAAGLEACSGGLLGIGETWDDRVELALQLRALGVDSVPINFLNPVRGTPLEGRPLLKPFEALRIVALYRFLLPEKQIKVCGGRNVTLRDLQSWVFHAGASGLMVGHYLTTRGRAVEDDLRMLADLGLRPRAPVTQKFTPDEHG